MSHSHKGSLVEFTWDNITNVCKDSILFSPSLCNVEATLFQCNAIRAKQSLINTRMLLIHTGHTLPCFITKTQSPLIPGLGAWCVLSCQGDVCVSSAASLMPVLPHCAPRQCYDPHEIQIRGICPGPLQVSPAGTQETHTFSVTLVRVEVLS